MFVCWNFLNISPTFCIKITQQICINLWKYHLVFKLIFFQKCPKLWNLNVEIIVFFLRVFGNCWDTVFYDAQIQLALIELNVVLSTTCDFKVSYEYYQIVQSFLSHYAAHSFVYLSHGREILLTLGRLLFDGKIWTFLKSVFLKDL